MKRIGIVITCIVLVGVGYFITRKGNSPPSTPVSDSNPNSTQTPTHDPLTIAGMKQKSYPGSDLHIEQTLSSASNYHRYIVSYQSDGLTEYGLLTVPTDSAPAGGWPVIVFHHGYIAPSQYSTVESYASFVDIFASNGYVVFKPDYRGNGRSQGTPVQPYISPDYVTDSMNALASIKKYTGINLQKIGVYGHSMGGNIVAHELVMTGDIKAAEIMAGVIGDESGILSWWDKRIAAHSISGNDLDTSRVVKQMTSDHGTPSNNPDFWNSIDPTKFVFDISAPVQIQVGLRDTAVPPTFSQSYRDLLQKAGKTVDYKEYPGADHNLSPNTASALHEAVVFFDKYLK